MTTEESQFGVRSLNGSWSGLLGVLQRNEANLSAHTLIQTAERTEACHWSFPVKFDALTFYVQSNLIFTAPSSSIYFLDTFSYQVWLLTIFTLLLTIPLTIPLIIIWDREKLDRNAHNLWKSIARACTLLTQGSPNHLSSAVFLFVVLMCNQFLRLYYCGKLSSSTFTKLREEIETWDDVERVLQDRTYQAIVLEGSYYQAEIQKSRTGPFNTMRKAILLNQIENPKKQFEKYEMILLGNIISIGPEKQTKSQLLQMGFNASRFHVSGDTLFTVLYGFGYSKLFKQREEFDQRIIRFIETGLDVQWMRNVFMKIDKPKDTNTTVIYIGQDDFMKLIFILAAGLLLASTGFLTEFVLNRTRLYRQVRELKGYKRENLIRFRLAVTSLRKVSFLRGEALEKK